MDEFFTQFLITALWSSHDESTPAGGEPMDENYTVNDFDPVTLAKLKADCDRFQVENMADIAHDLSLAGHDFWLTRNGHGAGFWDGDWEKAGHRLTDASKRFGEVNLYIGDDKKIYA